MPALHMLTCLINIEISLAFTGTGHIDFQFYLIQIICVKVLVLGNSTIDTDHIL